MCNKFSNGTAFQGDIGFLKIGSLPVGVNKVTKPLNSMDRESFGYHPSKGLVLAQGESRQHYHAFRDTDNVMLYESSNDNRLFVEVLGDTPQDLVHEEHETITFDPGVYELFYQKEYTFEEEFKRVMD